MPCSPCPISWNRVSASSKESRQGAPLLKLLLLMMMGIWLDDCAEAAMPELSPELSPKSYAFQLRHWSRNSDIHAPDCLLARAKLSCRKRATRASSSSWPFRSRTSYSSTSGWYSCTPFSSKSTRTKRRPKSFSAVENSAPCIDGRLRYGFSADSSKSYLARRTFSAQKRQSHGSTLSPRYSSSSARSALADLHAGSQTRSRSSITRSGVPAIESAFW